MLMVNNLLMPQMKVLLPITNRSLHQYFQSPLLKDYKESCSVQLIQLKTLLKDFLRTERCLKKVGQI